MVFDKSNVKIRLETTTGEKVAIDDISASTDSRLSMATSKKLQNMAQSGGDLNLQDLVEVLDLQLKQKQQLKLQRYLIVAGVLLLLCSFGLSLGSSVLSFMLMNQLEVHDGAFTDKEGRVLGSQPRNPSVSNVTIIEKSARRLSSSNIQSLKIPRGDFETGIANYKSGATKFVVPVDDATFTVHIVEASGAVGTALSARGTVASGAEWRGECEVDAGDCSVTVDQTVDHLQTRAARRLGGFTHNAKAVGPNPYCECFNPTDIIRFVNDVANTCTMDLTQCNNCWDFFCYDNVGTDAEALDAIWVDINDKRLSENACMISCW